MTSRRDSWFWLVPALTFLAGLALGGVLVGVGLGVGDDEDDPQPQQVAEPEPSPSPSPSDDLVVRVPRACLEAADSAEAVVGLGERAVTAVSEFDALELRRIVDELQQLDTTVRADAEACRSARETS